MLAGDDVDVLLDELPEDPPESIDIINIEQITFENRPALLLTIADYELTNQDQRDPDYQTQAVIGANQEGTDFECLWYGHRLADLEDDE